MNLADYLLPDGYLAIDWMNENEIIIEKWNPYYYKEKEVNLKSGDVFNSVNIILKK